jgi:hypothetical protein
MPENHIRAAEQNSMYSEPQHCIYILQKFTSQTKFKYKNTFSHNSAIYEITINMDPTIKELLHL